MPRAISPRDYFMRIMQHLVWEQGRLMSERVSPLDAKKCGKSEENQCPLPHLETLPPLVASGAGPENLGGSFIETMLVKHLETQSSRYKNWCFDFGVILCGATISHRDSPVVELTTAKPIPTGNCLEGEGRFGVKWGVFRDSSYR